MLPVRVPEVSPAVLTDTVKFAGMVPLAGDTLNQVFPEVTAALTLAELVGDDPMLSVCDAGAVPPAV